LKKIVLNILKIGIPILVALYICWYIWSGYSAEQKTNFIEVFKNANYFYVFLALIVGLISHLSRAHRWRYMLRTMGYNVSLKASFHATMIGNIVNIILPKVGEVSRAGVLKATDNVPVDKGFGTVVAERVIDVICLMIVGSFALLINYDNISTLLSIGNKINLTQPTANGEESTPYFQYMFFGLLVLGAIALLILLKTKSSFKDKVVQFIKGTWEGLLAIFKMKDRWAYLFHTVIIWTSYVVMFWIPFYALDYTAELPTEAIMAAFIAGTLGFIIVQGGLGVYPIMVGSVITFFRDPDYFERTGNIVLPEDSGFASLIWLTQTVVVVILGFYALISVQRTKKKKQVASH
jgi:uncharacterized protein (TIRG00374 family)